MKNTNFVLSVKIYYTTVIMYYWKWSAKGWWNLPYHR